MANALVLAAIALVGLIRSSTAFAGIELVCKGTQPQSNNKLVVIDCSDRQAVIEAVNRAWRTLRADSIGGATENLCWNPYTQAREIHPSISFTNIAPTFFLQCNMALRYLK